MKFVLKNEIAKKMFETISTSITSEKIVSYQSLYLKKSSETNRMYVRAMDKTHVLQMEIQIVSDQDFSEIYIPFFEINKFLPKFKSQNIVFELLQNSVLKVSSGSSYCKTSLLNIEQSPIVSQVIEQSFGNTFSIQKQVFVNVKNKLNGIVSIDNNRPVLNGICLDIINSDIVFASSDGKKLTVYYTNKNTDQQISKQIIIPVSTINTVCSIFKSENVSVSFNDKFIAFESQGIKYFSSLISGSYPPYQKIVSSTQNHDKTVVIDKQKLVDALSFVNVNFDVTKKCEIKLSNNKLMIDYDSGANHEEFSVQFDGEISFLINSQFLEKMIKPVTSQNIIFKFLNSETAILMQADNLKMILMPLKANR